MRVWVRPDDLDQLAQHPEVAHIRLPVRAHPNQGSAISQGVALAGADILQSAQFDALSESQSAGDLSPVVEQIDVTGDGFAGGTPRGVNVAEVMLDMAPGASLALLKIADSLDFENAIEWANQNGVDAGAIALGFAGLSYYDDTGVISDAVSESARNHDVFWAVSAGNYAESHWRGSWSGATGTASLRSTRASSASD